MKIYEPGNIAKQIIFQDLSEMARSAQDRHVRILDACCGQGRRWPAFLEDHPHVEVVGIDMDERALERGRAQNPHARLRLEKLDAQQQQSLNGTFDVVVALSAMEHVVDHKAFLNMVWNALAPGGQAMLNYDVGHFRSHNVKERCMVPISQILAFFGVERYYMKRVNDEVFLTLAKSQGFEVERVEKHNMEVLRPMLRQSLGNDTVVEEYVEIEKRLASIHSNAQLDAIMLSTTVYLRKP